MPSSRTNVQTEEVTFARDLGLFEATMIGIGAMIGAGIFVLSGLAAGEAGPAAILAFALNGVVTLLTAFVYAELASAIPRAGGGYSFVRMAFAGAPGFVAGWMLWFAYTVACSLYALGFAGYFWEIFSKYTPALTERLFGLTGHAGAVLGITVLVGAGFTWLNARGAGVTGKTENFLTLAKLAALAFFVVFGLIRIFGEPAQVSAGFTPFLPRGLGGVFVAMGLTFIAFEGYDLIATVAEEIKEPEKNIPRATFISLGVTVVIYLLVLFVALGAIHPEGGEPAWQFLGRYGETAIVRAAEAFMPAFGVAIIVFGGLLSTTSALNATVMAASRVAFSMGRDLWLPRRMAEIDPVRRTPRIAILVTGAILLVVALLVPLEAVGSAASLMFLLTFSMVNLSVIALRRKYPEVPRRYKLPLYPYVPVLGFLLNMFLAVYQFKFQPIAWYLTAGWVAIGLLLYFGVFQKRTAPFEPQVLLDWGQPASVDRTPSVLVALHNPDNVETLLRYAYPVARQRGVSLVAVSVVQIPRQIPIREGPRFARHKESLLAKARAFAAANNFDLKTDMVVAHVASDGLLAAVERHRAGLLVMGWKGYTNTRDRIFGEVVDRIVRLAPCDLMLLKPDGPEKPKTCLLPSAGGPNARLAATMLSAIAQELGMTVTGVHVVAPDATDEQREKGRRQVDETLALLDDSVERSALLYESASVAGGIAKAGRDYSLVVIGAAKEALFKKMLFGEVPEKVARFSPSSVMVVKKNEGAVKTWFKRIMG
ncbi:MAG TPA: amino acid permease [Thermoleophilia bacterium]|nr:amino acid permease [Thermoleophilia bacterium]